MWVLSRHSSRTLCLHRSRGHLLPLPPARLLSPLSKGDTPSPVLEAAQYRVNVLDKENVKYTIERSKPISRLRRSSRSPKIDFEDFMAATGVWDRNMMLKTSKDMNNEAIVWDLNRLIVNNVMKKRGSTQGLLEFVVNLQNRSNEVVLSPREIVECTSYLDLITEVPSSSNNANIMLQPIVKNSSSADIVSSLCRFLAAQVNTVNSFEDTAWTFENTANLMRNLKNMAIGGGVDGVHDLINVVLQANALVRDHATLPQLSNAASGLQAMSAEYPCTKACLRVLANHIKYLSATPHTALPPHSYQAHDILSLFHVLKQCKIRDNVNDKQYEDVRAYVASLASILKSDFMHSVTFSLDNIYNDILSNMRNLSGRSKEEGLLLGAVQSTIKDITCSGNSVPVAVPSLKASCIAFEGLSQMSSSDDQIKFILGNLANNFRMSRSSISPDMLTSLFKGLNNKKYSRCPETLLLIAEVNKKLSFPQARTVLSDSIYSLGGKGGYEKMWHIRTSALESLVDLLPTLKVDDVEVRKLLKLLAYQIVEMTTQFSQLNNDTLNEMSDGFNLKGNNSLSNVRNADACASSAFYTKVNVVLKMIQDNTKVLSLLFRGISKCNSFTVQNTEGVTVLKAFGDGVLSLQNVLATQKHCYRFLASEENHSESECHRTLLSLTALNPLTVMKCFDGLSNMKGNNNTVNEVLSLLTNSLGHALSTNNSAKFFGDVYNADVYRVMWCTRGLYPGNTNNSPQMNKLLEVLSFAVDTPTGKRMHYCFDATTSVDNTLSVSGIAKAVYSFQNLNTDSIHVRHLINMVNFDMKKLMTLNRSNSLGGGYGKEIQDMTFGLRGMKSSHIEVGEFLGTMSSLLRESNDNWNAKFAASTLSSLQYLNSNHKGVCDFVSAISSKLRSSSGFIPQHHLGRCIDSLQGLSSDEPEVRSLLSTVVEKLAPSSSFDSIKVKPPSFVGFQRMTSKHPEVLRLLQAYTSQLRTRNENLSERDINIVLGSAHGLRGLHSDCHEVRDTVSSLFHYLTCEPHSRTRGKSYSSHSYPYLGFVASALYGMQNMSSEHKGVLEMLTFLAKQFNSSEINSKKLTPREVGMALIGLQGMSSGREEVRYMIKCLIPHIQNCDIPRPQNMARRNMLSWLVQSCIGFQNMSSSHPEVVQLLQTMKAIVMQCNGNLTTTSIAKAFIGIQNLREFSSSSPVLSVLPSSNRKEVNEFISVLTDKIRLSLISKPKSPTRIEYGVINGDFVCAAFVGLKNRDSHAPEIRTLMPLLGDFLNRCPIGFSDMEFDSSDSRSRLNGLSSHQLSTSFSCLNQCHIEHKETVDILNAFLPHFHHIRDCNVREAIGSIKGHFSLNKMDSGEADSSAAVNSEKNIFTGRHLSNMLFGLQNTDVDNANRDSRTSQSLHELFSLMNDIVNANCNTKLSERVVRGITISVRDSNNSIWSGEDVCVAMGAMRYIHINENNTTRDSIYSNMFYVEESDEGDSFEFFNDEDTESFLFEPYAYEMVDTLADCLHDMKLSSRSRNSDGSELSDDFISNKNESAISERSMLPVESRQSGDVHDVNLQRVISVPHLARAAFGLRHLSADNSAVQKALDAIVSRLQDSYIHYYFASHDGNDRVSNLLFSRLDDSSLGGLLQQGTLSLPDVNCTKVSTLCTSDDICLLLGGVGKMTLRYTAVGKLYREVARLIYDSQLSELSKSSQLYQLAVGQFTLEDISKVFYSLRYNQCSSEIRLVVASLTSQLILLSKNSDDFDIAKGCDVSNIMREMSSMSSSVHEVRSFLKSFHDYLQKQQARGGISMTPADISACLSSVNNMDTSSTEVQNILHYLCDRIEEAPPESMVFSTDELYASLNGLSGMTVGDTSTFTEIRTVDKIMDLIRSRCK